ncbi:MAG: CRISPR system precrRNA processing endoribonuclease RAMP protein Cas6 [Gammaproteobacteria bacterium]|nr:CRISPR system precrRNA processing endoribonuclease RAMP protein Cas6 [Gammaproteobacteria bacterium]MBU2006203.1 CRISPR system precrRNA processing endoribonuclease RAMP protein Cas6 [Gammaproteobacteria bacterium]
MNFQLPVARYRFRLRAETLIHFPAYAGSTWRGAFGHALRRTVCITREPECGQCLLWRSCVYSQIFETPAGKGPLLEKINAAPHPYILHPLATSGRQYARGEDFSLYLTLMGKAVEHLPYLIHALQQVGERGVGKQDGRFALQAVEQETAPGSGEWRTIHQPGGSLQALPGCVPDIPPLPEQVRLQFHTPYRALHEGKLVHAGRFDFQPFMMGVIRRISLLHVHHAGVELDADFKALSDAAEQLAVLDKALRWYEWSRYSSRQHTKVQMGGLLGSFRLPVEALEAYWPWLWLGQWVHVGKGAVMGMGEYSLDVL